ncbi:hypothetical protein A2U01_0104576, partial [Trifolium medium]|nr:hypothetical protein [Trifolium medium]
MFVNSVRGFKERYYVVRPMTLLATDSLYRTEVVIGENGYAQLDADGRA